MKGASWGRRPTANFLNLTEATDEDQRWQDHVAARRLSPRDILEGVVGAGWKENKEKKALKRPLRRSCSCGQSYPSLLRTANEGL